MTRLAKRKIHDEALHKCCDSKEQIEHVRKILHVVNCTVQGTLILSIPVAFWILLWVLLSH